MTDREQSRLQFSIEESVWLKKGQEVDELYSVALNPEVTIQEIDNQVCIKGYLCLSGEYRCAESTEPEEDADTSSPLSYRSFASLHEVKDENAKIDHRFPIDITLPKDRVQSTNDLYVTVDHFDYEMPTPACLEVSASVSVSGVYEDRPNQSTEEHSEPIVPAHQYENTEEDHSDFSHEESNPFPILEFESRRQPEHSYEESEDHVTYQAERREPQVGFASRADDRYDNKNAYTPHYMRDTYSVETKEEYEHEHETEEYEAEEYDTEEYDYEYEEDRDPYPYEEPEEEYEYEADDEYEEQPASRPPREENALYLTKMLTREEEALTKMKMCIIQAGDSLDSIAGRYDVPTSHLMRVNRLESEEIEEGQILYIPASASR